MKQVCRVLFAKCGGVNKIRRALSQRQCNKPQRYAVVYILQNSLYIIPFWRLWRAPFSKASMTAQHVFSAVYKPPKAAQIKLCAALDACSWPALIVCNRWFFLARHYWAVCLRVELNLPPVRTFVLATYLFVLGSHLTQSNTPHRSEWWGVDVVYLRKR